MLPLWQNGRMRICAAQLRPVAGDIASNLAKHLKLIDLAVAVGADLVYFPELSLTGYEPRLAKALATNEGDSRLDTLQEYSEAHNLLIGTGLPISFESGVRIGMVWFSPTAPRRTYAKQLLHADELPFFVRGESQLMLKVAGHSLAPAICYESLIPDHSEHAAKLGADIYLASVAKSTGGLAKALSHYPKVARKHNMYIVMSNCVGPSDDFVSVGHSAVWDRKGQMLARMDSDSEGVVLLDTTTGKADTHRPGIKSLADIVSGADN
jgi:predicted amidohydrolase